MDMKRLSAGNLRAAGYDKSTRSLRVELSGGTVLEYSGVSEDLFRRLMSSASAWSFYRDNIEEEFTPKRVR
jgi:hypothetical protein